MTDRRPRDTAAHRDAAAHILRAALHGVDPRAAVRRALALDGEILRIGDQAIDLEATERVFVVGAGKAACTMAQGAMDVLGRRIGGGTITTRYGYAEPVAGIDVWEASHPIPDTRGLAGASEALRTARHARAGDLLLCVLSGGASALWPAPPSGISLRDLQQVTDALLRAGAPIQELNSVRKHLSRISGGQLARAAHPARIVTLTVSDVVASPLDVIASGPAVPDPTTFADALEVVRRRGIEPPTSVRAHLQAGMAGEIAETPKPGDPVFERTLNHIVARNLDALQAATQEAEQFGYEARIVTDRMEGEARGTAREIVTIALRASDDRPPGSPPLALLWGGETTVTVTGEGRGGRNQELALEAAILLDGEPGVVLAALGTDGTDGPTDAAGGVVDGGTVARGREAGSDPVDCLHRNDSYTFLQAAGDLIVTGPTGTNVNDVVLVLVG